MADRIAELYQIASKKGVLAEGLTEDMFREQTKTDEGLRSFYDYASQNGMNLTEWPTFRGKARGEIMDDLPQQPQQPAQPSSSQPSSSAQPAGVSGGSLLDEQAELARQNAYQGVTNDPNQPFVASQTTQPIQGRELKMDEVVRPKGYENLTDEQLNEQIAQLSGNVHEQKARELYKARYGKDYVEPEEPKGWWERYFGNKGREYANERQRYAEAVLDASRIEELDNPGAAKRRNEQVATLKQEKAYRDRQVAMPKLGEEIKDLQQRILSNEKQDGNDMRGAKHLLNQTIDLYNAPSKYGRGSGIANWGQGLADQITDYDTWTAGVTELVRYGNLNGIVNKMNKGGYDTLTKEEQLLLETFLMSTAVQDMRSDLSTGYEIGKGAAESIPFMVEMYLTAGAGAAAKRGLVQLAERKVGKAFAEKLARSLGGTAIRDAAGNLVERGATQTVAGKVGKTLAYDFAQTAAMPSTYSNIYKDRVTEILQGDGNYGFKDLARSFTGQMVETGTERWGGRLIDRGMSKMIPIDATALWGKNKLFGHFVENYINSPIGETGEEVIAAGVNTLRSLNPLYYHTDDKSVSSNKRLRGELGEMLTPEGLGKTFLTILPMSIFGGGANAAMNRMAANAVVRDYGQSRQALQSLLESSGATPEEANRIVNQIEASDSDRAFFDKMNMAYNNLLNKYMMENPNAPIEDVKAYQQQLDQVLGDYTKQAGAYNQMVGDLMEKYEKLSDNEKRTVDSAMEDYMVRAAEEFASKQQPQDRQTQLRQQATEAAQQEVQGMTHQDGNVYYVGIKGKDGSEGYAVSGNLNMQQDDKGMYSTSGRDLVTVKMNDGSVQQVPADELVVRDLPVSANELIQERTDHYFAQYANNDLFHVGDKVYLKQNGQQSAESSTIVDINDEGIEVEIIDPNGQPNTTIIPHEEAAEALAVAEGETEDNIVTYNVNGNELRLRDLGNGTYETLDAEEGAAPHRFTDADLAQLGAQRVDQPVSSQPLQQPVIGQAPVQAPLQTQQPPQAPQQQQFGSNAPGIDELSAEDFAAQTVSFMQSPKVAQGYLTAERAKVNAQLQQLENEGVVDYTNAEDYRTKAQQIEQTKARLQAQLEKIDGAIAAINAQAEAAVARKNLNEAIRKRAAEFSKQLGANIVIFDSLEQIPESQAAARAAYQKVGDDLDAWYDETTGDIYMNANAFEDMQRFEEKVFHEVVSHKGLDQLLGKAKYEKLCDAVWNSMSEASRNQYMAYARATHIRGSEKEFQRIAAKEYIAFLSERRAALELNDQSEEANTIRSEWAKICEFLKDLFSKIFGNVQITDEDLAKLVHASFVNMQRQAQGITEEQAPTDNRETTETPTVSTKHSVPYRTLETDRYGQEIGYTQEVYDEAFRLEQQFAEELDRIGSIEDESEFERQAKEFDYKNLPKGYTTIYDEENKTLRIIPNEPTQYDVGNLHKTPRKFKVGELIQVEVGGRFPHVYVTEVDASGKVVTAIDMEDGRTIISDGHIRDANDIMQDKQTPEKVTQFLNSLRTATSSKPKAKPAAPVKQQPVTEATPEERLAQAEAETDTNPTEAQKKAENYKQGHVTLWGLPITIENPKGSIRRGTDANGKQWEQEMHHTYGKIRRTEGVDGDHIDVFIGPNLTSDKVFVVDQRNVDTGEFDEHKCMLGFDSLEEAQNGYLSNYEEGWQGMGSVTEVTMDEFKKWIDSSHRKTKPFAEYKSVKTEGADSTAMEQAPTDNRETTDTPAEDLTPLEAAQKRKAAREAAKAAEQAAQTQGESEMLTRLRELQEGEDQQAPQDYLHSLTDEQLDVLEDEVNELWNKARTENNLRDLNDPQIREQYPEAWKTLLLRNRVSAENSRRYDMQITEESIANRKAHTESEELRRYYEYEFAYMRASASNGDVLKAVHDAEEYLAGLSYEELAKIYNEIVRLQSEHDVPWILSNAYRARSANMENEGVFDYGLNHQGEIPEGKANKPKINASDWTAKDDLRPVLQGVYHDPTGVGVVTNAHILMATPSLYDPAQEGKIVKKDGSTVDGQFPNWQGVVDQARRINKKEATVDWTAIRNFIAGIKAKMKEEGNPLKKDSLANIIIRMPDGQVIIYRLNMFIPFADAAAAVGANTLHYSPINGQTLAENNGTQLVLMPVDPESFRKNLDWGYKDNFYYDLQPKQDEPVSAETPKTESKPERKPKPTRKKAAPAEQTQAPVETDAEVIETQKPKNTDKIEDVGEKIGGARKDIVQETVDRINVNGDTFAKIFPKFDYHKLIANGLEPRLAAGLKYVCEHAKKSYKIRKKRFGENNALEATRFMANYAKGYLLGDTSLDFTSEGWVFTAYGKRRYEFGIKLWESLREAMGDTMFDVDLSGYDCDVIQSEEERKAEAEEKGRTYRPSSSIYYRRNADGESVEFTPRYAINTPKGDKLFTAEEYDQAVQYFQDQVTSAINYQAANPFELAIYRKRGSDDCCVHAKIGGKWVELTPWGKEYGLKYRDEHRAELQAMAQRKAEELKEQRKNTRPEAKVELRLTRREDGTYGNQFQVKLGKEYVPIKDDIMPITDSYNYLREHREELTAKAQEMLNAYLDEQEANRGWKPQLNIGGLRNRVGTDWRNGADVTAERFRTEFGFRGVEFGNYVTQKERQRLLNECFDALHDMAEILGVSPRALSLNGQLGFAIGARGGAGAKAHYEPGKNVINLTKKNGWGALAHEWWHAMDYYFGKREKERPATGGVFREDVRKQMQDAFAAVMKAINGSEYLKRSQNLDAKTNKHYYAEDTELGARAFEDYIAKQLIARGQVNDFLSHHTSEEDWNGDISNYPYPIEKDGTALADAFQSFFDTVEEQEDASTGNSVLFSVTDKKYAQFALTQANNPMLDDVHTGIRSVEDIHTLEETLNDERLLVTEPDWEEEDIRRAIEDNQVTIYSSKPIQDGTFVTPSRMVAEDYAGGEMVYEKTVSPDKVAWIASDEGQYADTDHYNGNILFSITNANNEIFYSNAERAVESIKQDKATPEQWRAMIEKAGGLKAGEDKWIGLSDWLAQQRPTIESHPDETPLQFAQRAQAERKKFTISKQEILHYIRANKIQIEETEYGETTPENNPTFRAFQDEVTEMWENVNRMQNGRFNEANQDIIRFEDDMQAKYGDDWRDLMDDSEHNVANYLQERRDEINMEVFLPEEVVMEEMCNRHGDDFQLAFSIDDDGSLSIANEDAAGYYLDVNPINDTRLQYTTDGLTNKHEIAMTVPTIEAWNETDEIHFGDAGEGKVVAWARFGDATDEQGNKTLVIDEIQSKRHQEGREKGYKATPTEEEYKEIIRREKVANSLRGDKYDFEREMKVKYGSFDFEDIFNSQMTDAERDEWRQYDHDVDEAEAELHELKDRFPYDPSTPPAAPFEKNWHELAMKRILRFAAENGYDKVAWTTGDQQAARYNIGEVIDSITRNEDEDYPYSYSVMSKDHGELEYDFDEDGIYHDDGDPELDGKSMSDVFGKELAKRLQEMPAGETIDNEGLRIGGEGMRGFYDDILPRFMQKYGKKWGVKVGEVTMPQLEDGYQTMHAIDINDAMRESVMEGQPMFSITPKAERIEKLRNSEPIVVEYNGEYELNRKSAKDWAKKNIRGEYVNLDTQDKVAVSGVGIDEVLSHGEREEEHLKSIIAIPQMIKNSIFIEERGKEHENSRYERYKYYVCGLKIDGVDYTAKIVIGVKNGISYYDHQLTRIEKGRLIDSLNELSNPVANNQASKIDGKDKKLFSILQINPQENAENVQNSSENADFGEETPKNTSLDQVLFSIKVNHNSPYLLKKADGSFVDPTTGERLGFDHRFMGRGEGNQAHGYGSYFSVRDLRNYAEGGKENLLNRIDDVFDTAGWDRGWRIAAGMYLNKASHESAKSFKKWMEDKLASSKQNVDKYEGMSQAELNGLLSLDELDILHSNRVDVRVIPEFLARLKNDTDTRIRHHYSVEIPDNDGTNYIEERQPMNARARKAIMDGLIADGYTMEEKDNGEFGWYEFNKGDFREDPDNQISLLKEDETYGDFIHDNFHGYDSKMIARVSKYLSDAGVVGIHYDGRRDGECYVIFDENDAKIVDHVMFSITEKDPLKRWEAENPKPEAKEGEPTIDYAKRLQQWNIERRKVKDAIKDAQPSYDHAEYDGVLFSTTPPFTGETIGDLYAGARQRSDLNRKRRESAAITDMLIKLSKDNYWRMQEALHKINADIRALRKATAMQADLDRSQVEALLDLTNQLIQVQWGGGSDNPAYQPQTMATIIQQVRNAIGKADISEEVGKIEDYLVHAQRVAAKNQWDKLRRTPFEKLNISGVVTQGKVAIQGQHALKALNEALNSRMTVEQLEEEISLLYQKIDEATDESLRTQYTGRMIGYETARQHLERLEELMQERQQLRNELEASRTKKELSPAARRELEASIKETLRDNNLRQAEAYTQSVRDLQEYVSGQTDIAKNFIEQQRQRTEMIRGYAAKDLEGASADPHRTNEKQSGWRKIWDAFASPIRDLQSLLRLTGLHAPDGEGYLYNHFMRNWTDAADKERQGIVAAQKTLDAKISELTHGKYKTWEEAARDIKSKSHNKLSVSLWTGKFDGAQPVYEDRPIDAGNALYIYAVNKMNDGRMKLTAMNITDQKVRDLANQVKEMFGQEILDVVDWVQREFFSELRNRYNPTHEALFGAPMDAIENYFPLRINASARQKDEDITEPDDDTSRLLSGTSTGAIKRRKRNSLPLDVRNADFFQEVIRHVAQMERWNAFAQWTRDSNILFSDIDFRNKIKNMDTIYGKGDKLYTYMKKAFQTAVGVYKPQSDIFSEMTLNLAKGVTSAKINFRVFTALKQLASFPAFFTYMTESGFVKSYMSSWVHPHDTMKWAKANLPSFEKRVSKRDMGDMRLMQRSTDWEWNKRMLELSQKYGMYFNVLFDTLTCATGAKAVYESRLAEYKKKGYSTAVAESRARQDAEQAFNTSQQSSEGAYMAPVQMDRNIITAALTVFRTSPIQYTRNCFYHARNLIRKRGKGTKESMINFRIGQYIADGLTEEQARQAAEKDYNKSVARDIVGMVVYGALLGILWRMVGSLPYLVAGDDDDEKKKIRKKAVTGGAIVQPVTGLLGGGIVESAIDGYGNIADMFSPELPFTQDLKKAFDNIGNDKYAEAASQALSVMMQSATGFDPNTVADLITRTVTTLDSDAKLDAAQQAWQITGAVLSIPQSQYEQIMLDDLVKAGKGIDMSNTFGKRKFEPMYDKYLSDFSTNREVRTAPLTWYLRSDEQAQKAEASAERRFRKLLKERGLNDLPNTKASRDKKKKK